ncbi:enoyl-CoA hydratase-related protein [Legionella dresdenensis]|uniref:Enoyl-CoA hydratase-related protein n=1 Tax=Legionella dresdenensis TaxID=450200 RepID=A0ABV8CGU4_9GAMM
MDDLITELHHTVYVITFNRIHKHNAFDDQLLNNLQARLDEAIHNPQVRSIVLNANGKHFSAGADLSWMQRMATYSEQENLADAMVLAKVMNTLYESPKPTIAAVHGAAYGGGAGLAAACDIAIAADTARFCFSEVRLGLIPAVISPYVVKAIGERAARWLFMSADVFEAKQAKELGLIHYCISEEELLMFTLEYAQKISQLAPQAVADCKLLVNQVSNQPVTDKVISHTASLIAKKRVSAEGQRGLHAFLNKETPKWD